MHPLHLLYYLLAWSSESLSTSVGSGLKAFFNDIIYNDDINDIINDVIYNDYINDVINDVI